MANDLKFIPQEMLELIPLFDGNYIFLSLFIRKAEYVVERYKVSGNAAQDEYIFHAITTRLTGMAASFVGERSDLKSWDDLKAALRQYFRDPRSEECIRMELENLRMNPNSETYYDFCNRIKQAKRILMAKVNEAEDNTMTAAKAEIYNKLSLNTFLYNLPENIVSMVRLKGCINLEAALAVVTEELNFQVQYNSKRSSKFFTQNTHQFPIVQSQPPNILFGAGQSCGSTTAAKKNPAQISSARAGTAERPISVSNQPIFGNSVSKVFPQVFDGMAPSQQVFGGRNIFGGIVKNTSDVDQSSKNNGGMNTEGQNNGETNDKKS